MAIVAGIVSVISSLAGTVVGMFFLEKLGRVSNFQLAAELAVAIMVLIGSAQGVYIGRRILVGDPKFSLIYPIAINFTSIAGTSFRNADLTKADFTGAVLKNADFTKAKLVHTRFYKAKQLDLTRTGDTILSNRRVLKLLVTGNGRNKSYAGLNLKGANLIGADLKEANLKNADITQATFQGACLEWTNLTLATAVGTDFTNSLMTGACVEAWNIESTTNLDNVDCRFIYLLENTKPGTDDKERRPSSGEFRPGEFTKLFEEVFNTVDLIFRDGIDWKAFVTAFKKVQVENENTELAIQSIENKGDGVVVVKVAVPVDTDKEKIHSGFTQNYRLALQEIEKRYKAELQAKDKEIEIHREKSSDMKEIIGLLANRPIQNIIDVKQNQGDTNMTGERNIHMGSGNYNERIEGDYVQGNYYAAGEKQTLAETAAEIQALLKQLEKSYPTDTTTGKMALATEAIAQIESNPNLKVRILSALKVGSIKAFEQCLSHPAAS
ncbi:MAG: pentapeptide repeat-containing protein, partial [Cyanobacteria bacterium J06639_18]